MLAYYESRSNWSFLLNKFQQYALLATFTIIKYSSMLMSGARVHVCDTCTPAQTHIYKQTRRCSSVYIFEEGNMDDEEDVENAAYFFKLYKTYQRHGSDDIFFPSWLSRE